MNKQNKTNKKNGTIEWPANHFTIDDLQKKYAGVVNITLRFRVKKALEKKEIVSIGKIKPAIGRPKLVFARTSPSKELLDAAKAAGVIFEDGKSTISLVKKTAIVSPATTSANEVSTPVEIPVNATVSAENV